MAHWLPKLQPGQPRPFPEPQAGIPGGGAASSQGAWCWGPLRLGAFHQLEKRGQQRNFWKEILARNFMNLFPAAPLHGFTSLGLCCVVTFHTRAPGNPGNFFQGPALPATLSGKARLTPPTAPARVCGSRHDAGDES